MSTDTPIPENNPFAAPEDAAEFKQFKRRINSNTAYDVTQEEPKYLTEYRKYAVHKMDPKTATVVIDTFYFSTKEAAQAAIDYAKTLREN